jgi:hypothetical protein
MSYFLDLTSHAANGQVLSMGLTKDHSPTIAKTEFLVFQEVYYYRVVLFNILLIITGNTEVALLTDYKKYVSGI